MAKIRILISLTTNDNDYQIEQAQSAEQAASKLGVSAEIIYANNDAIRCAADCLPRPFLFLLTPDKPSKCLCKRFGRKSVLRSACSPCLPRFLLLLRSNLSESHSLPLQKASYNAARRNAATPSLRRVHEESAQIVEHRPQGVSGDDWNRPAGGVAA